VPLLEQREKAHFMRIEEHEWAICNEQLEAGWAARQDAASRAAAGRGEGQEETA
jgi:transketolase